MAVMKAAIFEFAIAQVREAEIAIFKDAILKGNSLKFRSIENAVGEDHLPVGAPESAGAGPGLVGVNVGNQVLILDQLKGFRGGNLNSFKML